jgi:hypothetical protein
MKSINCGKALASLAFAAVLMTACSDSTGPTSLEASAALQSLAIGLTQIGDAESASAAETRATFDAIAPLLDKVSVTFDGVPQNMYALALRQTFPAGTCQEAVFIDPQFPPQPGVCTPISHGVATLLWQTRSASKAPDKLILISTDVGANNFDVPSTIFIDANSNFDVSATSPAFALYVAGQDKLFVSESGTITTNVTSSGTSCDIPAPPYAKSATCSIATITDAGTIVMAEYGLQGPTGKTLSVGIPSISMDGLWIDITEVQPITLTANRGSTRVLGSRIAAIVGAGLLELAR